MNRSFARSVPGQIMLVGLVGVVSGVAWSAIARPAQWQVADGRLELSVGASADTFGVLLAFVAVGAVASLLWSVLATWLLGATWQHVVTIVLGCLVAALLCWQIGVLLGPPDPSSVAGLSDGDRVDDRLAVDGIAPFVVWPMFGLIGVLLVTWPSAIRDRRAQEDERAMADTTAWVDDTRS